MNRALLSQSEQQQIQPAQARLRRLAPCRPLHALSVIGLCLVAIQNPVEAATRFSLELGAQYDQVDEYVATANGGTNRVVRETGARPFVAARLDASEGPFSGYVETRISDGRLDYAGQTNLGGQFDSHTDYREIALDLGLRRTWAAAYVQAGLLEEWRDRDIRGSGAVAGLSERYQHGWLYLGTGVMGPRWRVGVDAMLGVHGQQTIRFENTYDPAKLPLGDAWGLRLAFEHELAPIAPGRIALEVRHLHTEASERRNLSIQGAATANTVYQPEMARSAVNLRYRLSW